MSRRITPIRTQFKQNEPISIEQQLSKLEDDIRRLKIDFDIYFNSSNSKNPSKKNPREIRSRLEAKARIEAQLKRLADNRTLSFAQRYQFNTIVSRFTSYRELWRRTMKARGEDFI